MGGEWCDSKQHGTGLLISHSGHSRSGRWEHGQRKEWFASDLGDPQSFVPSGASTSKKERPCSLPMCPCLGGALSALPGSVHSFSHNAVSCEHLRWREVVVQIALIQLLYIT